VSGPSWPRDRWLRLCRAILRRASSSLGPVRDSAWLAEWEAELWTLHGRGAGRLALLRFALDGWFESRWERRRQGGAFGSVTGDFRHALRRLRRSPGFAVVAVLVLGLGVGANTALFSALRAVLLTGLPYPEADRLVIVDALLERPGSPPDTLAWSWPKFEAVRESLSGIERAEGFFSRTSTLTGAGDATRIGIELVTPGYFDLLGIRAQHGRVFGEAAENRAEAGIALLTHGIWATRFGADPGVIGRTLVIDDAVLEIVGVLPPGFRGLSGSADMFVPVAAVPLMAGGARRLELPWSHWLRVVGRLERGVSVDQARVHVAGAGARLTEAFPHRSMPDAIQSVTVVPLDRARVNPTTRLAVAAVSAAGVLLLLIACGNVAGLMLARGRARRTDTAVRAALGAGRGRLIRESLAESVLLAGAAGALGIMLAVATQRWIGRAATHALDASGGRDLQFVDPRLLGVDAGVLGAGLGLVAAVVLLAGLLPAWLGARPDFDRGLRSGARLHGSLHGDAAELGRAGLVVVQITLTVLLLAGTGLLAASFARLSSVDVGFTHRNVLALRYERGSASEGADHAFEAMLLERLRGLPGVQAAAIGLCAPLAGVCEIRGLRRLDDREVPESESVPLLTYAVDDDYFGALGIPLRAGRVFDGRDATDNAPVVVINEAAARLFAGESPIGHRIGITHELTSERPAEIVGVVADVPYGTLEGGAIPAVYLSRRQAPSAYGTIFLRVATEPTSLVDAVRAAVAHVDPTLPLYDITTLEELEAVATARTRVVLWLLAVFAVTGLLLSAVGLYGIVAYAVAGRTREMGVRLALGASAANVVRIVLTPAVRLVIVGTVLGIAAALALTRFLGVLLYGITPSDPRVLGAAAVVLLVVAATAAAWPAMRATRVDPAVALRGE
jgi:putative ABC transport system permease protein